MLRFLKALASAGTISVVAALASAAFAEPQTFTQWGWPQPYEKVSEKSVSWLKEKGNGGKDGDGELKNLLELTQMVALMTMLEGKDEEVMVRGVGVTGAEATDKVTVAVADCAAELESTTETPKE